jgi:ubiquinone/menaquinone biosynthesis C-methylase UbiE
VAQLSEVKEFWNKASCGEIYSEGKIDLKQKYEVQSRLRYELEPYLKEFANFNFAQGKNVLEVGVGMGADHQQLAMGCPKSLYGIDLTSRAIEHTSTRFQIFGLNSNLKVGNAENLEFSDESFDFVYSWGVIHHSPNTQKACEEIYRVLKIGGLAKIMIYHKYSIVGFLLWFRYGLLKGTPFRGLTDIYHHFLESPGTKAYTVAEAKQMFSCYENVEIKAVLSFGDLLSGEVGQRHQSSLLNLMKIIWPRQLIKAISKPFNFGLCLLITAKK